MKLVVFVRDDLWNVREDRKALSEVLIKDFVLQNELSEDQVHYITQHPSALLNDAETTFSFIDEVAKTKEMEVAISGKGVFPRGNWIHSFSSFQDIVDTLKVVFNFGTSLNKAALSLNLRRELLFNLTHLTSKHDSDVFFRTNWAMGAWRKCTGVSKGESTMTGRDLQNLGLYLLFKGSASRLSFQFTDQALNSGEFLHYDFEGNNFRSGVVHDALHKLKENIAHFQSIETVYGDEIVKLIGRYSPRNDPGLSTENEITLSNSELLIPFAFLTCEINIGGLCIAIIKALEGNETVLKKLELFPRNPFPDEAEKVDAEWAIIEDVDAWIKKAFSLES